MAAKVGRAARATLGVGEVWVWGSRDWRAAASLRKAARVERATKDA